MEETTALPTLITPEDVVYRDRNQSIQRIVATFEGFTKEYFVSDHGHRAAVLVLSDGKVLLTRQYRLLVDAVTYEIPGGRVDEQEIPEAAAVRECFEETGVRCSSLEPLIAFQPSLDIWKNPTHVYYSRTCETAEPGTRSRAAWIPFAECLDMVFDGRIPDSLSITALLAYDVLQRRSA